MPWPSSTSTAEYPIHDAWFRDDDCGVARRGRRGRYGGRRAIRN
jgi:hypothetical protein